MCIYSYIHILPTAYCLFCKPIVRFDVVVFALILGNAILVGIEANHEVQNGGKD